jgi:hypothetical protein
MPTSDDIVPVKKVVKALFKENGGHKHVMVKLDVGKTRAYGFTDRASDEHISFARVAALTHPQATMAARYLAQLAGGVFLPISTTKAVTTMAAVGEAVREHGEAISGTLAAMADGTITPEEVPPIVREIDEAFSALATLRGLLVQTAKEG